MRIKDAIEIGRHLGRISKTIDAWEESKHPRRPDGKFGSGGGSLTMLQIWSIIQLSPSVFLSMKFQAVLAAKLMDVTVAELEQLPAVDFRNVVLPVAGFLLGQA